MILMNETKKNQKSKLHYFACFFLKISIIKTDLYYS